MCSHLRQMKKNSRATVVNPDVQKLRELVTLEEHVLETGCNLDSLGAPPSSASMPAAPSQPKLKRAENLHAKPYPAWDQLGYSDSDSPPKRRRLEEHISIDSEDPTMAPSSWSTSAPSSLTMPIAPSTSTTLPTENDSDAELEKLGHPPPCKGGQKKWHSCMEPSRSC